MNPILALVVLLALSLAFVVARRVPSTTAKVTRVAGSLVSPARAEMVAKLATGLIKIGGRVHYESGKPSARLVGLDGRLNKPMAVLVGNHGRHFRRPFTQLTAV